MTTIYLSQAETLALSPLQGLNTRKRRYKVPEQGWTWCIDVWEAPARAIGTIIAEVETPSLTELEALKMPSWALREVTNDDRFSAIALAA